MGEPVLIAGAGPAGLAAAIVLARAGRRVRVLELAQSVGSRFPGDLQGVDNWSSEEDVLAELRGLGIDTGFPVTAVHEVQCAGPSRRLIDMRAEAPLFYLVKRGSEPGTLDHGLWQQASELGVDVRFGERCDPTAADIVATGPAGISGVAVGYVFATGAADQALLLMDRDLAPGGYAYLLIAGGLGTLATTFPADFGQAKHYLAATVTRVRELTGVEPETPTYFGGRGHFYLAGRFQHGRARYAGEAAGLQDFMLGFGIRNAMLSGALAARSLLQGTDYDALVRSRFQGAQQAAVVNRWAFELLGNPHIDRLTGWATGVTDPRAFLRNRYGASWKKRLLFPLARWRLGGRLKSRSGPAGEGQPYNE